MLSGLYLAPSLGHDKDQKLNILHLGTGAGSLPTFLVSQLGEKLGKITTVDISQDMLTLAQHYFGFLPSDKLESIHGDAHQYVMDSNQAGHFDIILCDVNCHSEDQSISPPWNFLSEEYLHKLSSLLSETGYLALNVLYYNNDTKDKVFNSFKTHLKNKFDKMQYLEIEDWSNKVFVMSRDSKVKDD